MGATAQSTPEVNVGDSKFDSMVDLRRILAEQGLDDNGFSPHSWRCEHPDRYPDACTCVADIIDAILAAGYRKAPERKTERRTHWCNPGCRDDCDKNGSTYAREVGPWVRIEEEQG